MTVFQTSGPAGAGAHQSLTKEPKPLLRRVYDWTMDFAANRNAMWALFIISFIESSVFPIPPDILLIPMVLAARDKAWKIAGICT